MSFQLSIDERQNEARITLSGELDAAAAPQFKDTIEKVASASPKRLVLFMDELAFLASAGLRVLIFARQKMGDVDIYVVGSKGPVLNTLKMSGFHQSVYLQDSYAT
ncbi:MAG: STAS domain-containing protein [Trueperaceae bacterium]|nr:MAG: STAS domain-containing protein [Trueperaceae bacterium]